MFIVGFIKLSHPRVLLNPVSCSTVDELYIHLQTLLDPADFRQDPLLTVAGIKNALSNDLPVRVNFPGYEVALLLGSADVIREATDSFKYADLSNKEQ